MAFTLIISEGELVNKQGLRDYLMGLKDGKYMIKKLVNKRTGQQNRYLWALYTMISKELGGGDPEFDKDYIHKMLAYQFLKRRKFDMEYVESTSNLSTQEMTEYIENIRNYMADFGVILPSAEERETLYGDE